MSFNNNNPKLKKILCYGDRNSFGINPSTNSRYRPDQRWTKKLETILNNSSMNTKFEVIEETSVERTVLMTPSNSELKPALLDFNIIFEKTGPVQYIIIDLGKNDLQKQFSLDTNLIAIGIDKLVKLIKRIDKNIYRNTQIIVLSPVRIGDDLDKISKFNFDKESIIKSYDLPILYEVVAKENNCHFIDIGTIANPSEIDGVHISLKDHEKIAHTLANMIVKIEKDYKLLQNIASVR